MLSAIENVIFSVFNGPSFYPPGIGSGIFFGKGETASFFASYDRQKEGLLLFRCGILKNMPDPQRSLYH